MNETRAIETILRALLGPTQSALLRGTAYKKHPDEPGASKGIRHKSMSKYSIITICFNEVENIRKTCESIVAQNYLDYEWIVIDGASNDGTLETLEEFRSDISILISEPDKGIYDAMNKGINLAFGEYLVFMNGGDAFASNQALDFVAKAPQKDLIYGDLRCDTYNGEIHSFPDHFRASDLLKTMLPHQASFYRRKLFESYGKYDTTYRIAADYDMNVRLLEIAKVSSHHIPHPLAIFDISGISSSKKYRSLRRRENHRIRMKYFPSYRWSFRAWRQGLRQLFRKNLDN